LFIAWAKGLRRDKDGKDGKLLRLSLLSSWKEVTREASLLSTVARHSLFVHYRSRTSQR